MTAFNIKQNDRRPYLQVEFTDDTGTAVNLTGASGVYFNMRLVGSTGTPKVNRAAANVTTAASGLAEYRWTSGDTDTPGVYEGEFEIEWTSGVYETHPNNGYIQITITDDIA